MDILQSLRKATAESHAALEKRPLLKRLMENPTLEEYIEVLKRFRLLHGALNETKNVALLEQDLAYYQVPFGPAPPPFIPSKSHAGMLGCRYVLEGSAHGRRMLYPLLVKSLGIGPDQGGAFFYNGGEESRKDWEQFCALLRSKIVTDEDHEACIKGAIRTFEHASSIFDGDFAHG